MVPIQVTPTVWVILCAGVVVMACKWLIPLTIVYAAIRR